MAQRVNPQVTQKIKELVQEGMTNPHEIRKVLNHYVQTVLCTENPSDPDDRAYFHVQKNHIYKAKLALELSKFDQHNLVKKISEWKTIQIHATFQSSKFNLLLSKLHYIIDMDRGERSRSLLRILSVS